MHDFARRLWSGSPGFGLSVARVLATPAAGAYQVAMGVRNWLYDNRLRPIISVSVPVISVGSLVVGGAGKTPVAGWLAGELLRRGRRPAMLHGGYAKDEPELHRRWHPDVRVYARKDRVVSAQQAIAEGADVLLLDDGFQHRRLHRNLEIVLIAAESWSQPKRRLPRGPYREPVSALRRAQIVLITRKTATREAALDIAARVREVCKDSALAAIASIRPSVWSARERESVAPAEAVVVAGIAQPELFAANVEEQGVRVFDRIWFPDHHEYDARDAERIFRAAGQLPIVTTAKDAVKLERLIAADRLRVLEQSVQIEEGESELNHRLDECLR
jgi:tetraacyldisaccharide 4'-kinase